MQTNAASYAAVAATAARLYSYMPSYRKVENATGVPSSVIAVLHCRESDADFNTYLGNGDALNRPTVNVPAGRGPFASWTAGAVDALDYDGLSGQPSWTVEAALYWMERFNGFGYRQYHNERTPYLWAATNQQQPGKYVADGQFDSAAMDAQLGCAPLLAALWKIDPALSLPYASGQLGPLGQSAPVPQAPPLPKPRPAPQAPVPPPPDIPAPEPLPSPPAGSYGAGTALAAIIAALVTAGFWFEHAILKFLGF